MNKSAWLSAVLALMTAPAAAGDVQYLGDFCWQGQSDLDAATAMLELGVLSYGDGHFPLHGRIIPSDGPAVVVSGNTEVTPAGIEASLQGSELESGEISAVTLHLLLDPITFNGSYRVISVWSESPGEAEAETDRGTATLVPCQ